MPGSRASFLSTSGRWLEIVVRQRSARAVLEHQVQERVDRMQSAAVQADLAERLADHRRVGAVHDVGVEEVAVPHPHAELALVVLAELAAIGLVAHQLVAFHLVAQVQCGGAGAELLEDHQVDAVGVHLERDGQMLPAEVAAEPVHQPRHRAHHPDGVRVGLDVGRRQQAGLERLAEDAQRLRDLRAEVERVLDVRAGLQDPARPPQQRLQPAQLARLGVRRRQRARPAGLTVELVEKQLLRGHSDEAGVAAPRRASRSIWACSCRVGRSSLRVARSRPMAAVRMSEWPMNAARFGPSGSASSASTYSSQFVQVLCAVDGADDVLAGDGLDAAEQVAGVDAVDVDGRQRARPEHHRRHAVPQRLRQRRAVEHLDVVVGVDVEHARHHPLAGRVDDLRAVGLVEVVRG